LFFSKKKNLTTRRRNHSVGSRSKSRCASRPSAARLLHLPRRRRAPLPRDRAPASSLMYLNTLCSASAAAQGSEKGISSHRASRRVRPRRGASRRPPAPRGWRGRAAATPATPPTMRRVPSWGSPPRHGGRVPLHAGVVRGRVPASRKVLLRRGPERDRGSSSSAWGIIVFGE